MRALIGLSGISVVATVLATRAFSQTSTTTTTAPGGPTDPSSTPLVSATQVGIWQGAIRDWHSTDWQMTEMLTNQSTGQLEPQVVRKFTEVGGGINYISDVTGAWERATDNIDLMTNSPGAVAAHGPTKVFFSPTLGLSGPTIRMISCSNVVLQIQPTSIYYVDELGNSALLANLRPDAEGELVPPNRVLYRSVTTNGLAADLIFTYTRGAFESDLLILSQPSKTPDMLGLDPLTARISLVHSVKGVMPTITVTSLTQEGLADAQMDFSGLSFPQGYAFSTWDSGETNDFANPGTPAQVHTPSGPWDGGSIPVAKRIIPIGFQQWGLVEDVRWADIKYKLDQLPAYTQGGNLSTPKHASLDGKTPDIKSARKQPAPKLMKVASTAYRPKAVDLDFISVVGGSAYTFASGQTYFLTAPVSFSGTVNLYGSCVIKETNGASLTLNGPVNCYGTWMNPSIITSFNDWAVGEDSLPGSTGYPTILNQTALKVSLTNSATTLSGLKIRFAQTALEVDGNPSLTSYLTYSSMEWCTNGLYAGNCTVNVSSSYRCNVTTQTNGTGTWNIVGSLQDECTGSDNGLPQSWEFEYFAQGGISASADPDGDGLSNLAEYTAGTNPNVYDGPKILTQPQSQTVVVGNNASFSVGATGTGTLSYQWYRAGVPISGATTSSYSISNVQLTNSTYYFSVVTNLYGIVSSASVFLSVAIPTNGVPAPSGIVAWWPGNGNDNDAAGTNNGTIASSYVNAEVGQGFKVQNSSSVVRIPAAPALNIGINNGFTVEGWIDPYDTFGRPVIEWAPTNSYGVHVWINFQGTGSLWVNIFDTAGNSHIFQSAVSLISANTLQHLAVTYDKTTGFLQLLINGSLKTNYSLGIFPPQTAPDLWLGCRPLTVNGTGGNFNGIIDEISLYNRVLGTNEIAAIYNAATYGKFIVTPPTITGQPYGPGYAIAIGSTTNMTVTATGATPLSYQWMFNGNAIAGATTSSYTISNIQLTNQGVYSVVVANIAGSALSSSGTGSLLVNNYCVALFYGITDWWRAEQNANDQVGTNNGQWVGTANYTNGQIGQAFSFTGTISNYVSIPNSATLQLTNAFTIEFWCKDTGLANGAYGGLFAKRPYTGACNFGITLIGGSTMDTLLVYLLDPNYHSGNYQGMSCASFPHDGAFHHIAVTYNQNTSTQIGVQAFVDGASVGTATFDGNLANTLNAAPGTIGASNYSGEFFKGLIDELSVYSQVLTSTEIGQIALSPIPGKCYNPPVFVLQPQNQSVLQGTTPLISSGAIGDLAIFYQWYRNGAIVPGTTSYAGGFWITNIQPFQAGNYWSVASNIVGFATSSVASITVLSPPTIVTQPANQEAPLTANATFTVTASGTLPLSYQWNLDGAPIPGAISSSYNIPSIQIGNYGNYSVLVTNLYGSVLSTNAALSYASPCTQAPSGLVAWWTAEGNVNDSIGTNNGYWVGAASYTNGVVGQAFSFNGSNHVQIPYSPSLRFVNGFTFELWYKDTGSAGWYALVDNRPCWYPALCPCNYGIDLYNGNVGQLFFMDTNYSSYQVLNFPVPSSGVFHHLAATYQQSDSSHVTMSVYVDGGLQNSGTFPGNLTNTWNNAPVTIGDSYADSGADYLKGAIDEVSFYSRVLSPFEIQSIYFATSSGKCTSPPAGSLWVNITSPTNTQTFLEHTNIPLQAAVYDNTGTSETVKFYVHSNSATATLIGTGIQSTNNPSLYNLTWSNVAFGNYPITVQAVDNLGLSNSAVGVFTVIPATNYPIVSVTYPLNGSVFLAGTNITITASASPGVNGAAVTNVVFLVNDTLLGNDPQSPYSITECCWSPGTYSLTALAMDNSGKIGVTSNAVTITVGAPNEGSGNGFWDPVFGNPGVGNPTGGQSGDGAFLTAVAVLGSNLYVAGYGPGNINGTNVSSVAKWDGTTWTSLAGSPGLSLAVHSIQSDGNNIYVVGDYVSGESRTVAKWTGANWVQIASNAPVGLSARAMTIMGSDIYAGGDFSIASMQNVMRLNPINWMWESVGNGLNGPVYALANLGGHLYAGGTFTSAGGNSNANGIAELIGTNWTNLGIGVGGTNSQGLFAGVYSLAACGNSLFVGGEFTKAGGNTNANGIAKWDGSQWTPIQNGLLGTDTNDSFHVYLASSNAIPPALRVASIVAQGNTLYVGGEFRRALQGTNLVVNHIAKAVWSDSAQNWTWTDLDQGLVSSIGNDFVLGMAVMQGTTPGSYDLFVGGNFDTVGAAGTYSHDLARWSVGKPYPTNVASVTITAPANGAVLNYTPGGMTPLKAVTSVTNYYTTVQFFVDGSPAGLVSQPPFTTNWTLSAGAHLITARVTDANLVQSAAVPVAFTVTNSSATVQAVNDYFAVFANSAPNYLPVLTNDTPSSGLKISAVGEGLLGAYGSSTLGTVGMSFDQQYLVFTPTPNVYGTNILSYSVTNSTGSSDAFVTVRIEAKPVVNITNPPGFTAFTNSASLTISGTAVDYDGTVTSVQILTNGVGWASLTPSAGGFSTNWVQTNAGFYTFTALATDNDGNTSSSLPITVEIMEVNTNAQPPVAKITSPAPATTNIFSYVVTNAYVVRNGQLSLSGSAYSPDPGAAVAWQVILVDPTNPTNTLYNVTPGLLNSQGFATNAVNAGVLGTNFDLSLVQNGTYLLTLVVQSEGLQNMASLLIQVESNLKIGQFSFSEQDLVLPVNGIPITITRTYNSINPISSDFGYSWTFAINDMDVQLDEQRTSAVVGSPQILWAETEEDGNVAPVIASIRTGGSYDVTLTLPDGRRTTFGFAPFSTGLDAFAQWTAPPGVYATLTNFPFTSGAIDYFPALMWHDSDPTWGPEPFYNHDVPGWMLQTQDGTQYIINRGARNTVTYNTDGAGTWRNILTYGPPKLTSIVQRTGDVITISTNGITHSTTNNSTVTRSVSFVRDGQNRITAIYDPNTATNGLPTVQYIYDNNTGNLLQVVKLLDSTLGTTSTNRYHYDLGSQFPHFITRIDNGLGVPITRNFYDSSGRLIATVDPNNNTNLFIHNLTNSLELVIDRLGRTNTFAYDSRGNVTASTNALKGITLSAYDTNNNKISEIVYTNGAPYATNTFGYDLNTGLLLATTNALGFTNGFSYNSFGQLTTSIDALGNSSTSYYDPGTGNLTGTSDALGHTTADFYDNNGLLKGSTDTLGTLTTNFFDSSGNLTNTATISTNGTILNTNSFGYDLNGNRTNSTVWRRVNGNWSNSVTAYIYDAQNRVVQTIDPDGGTNIVVFDVAGRQQQTIDKLNRPTSYSYDFLNRLVLTTFPDSTTTASFYDANGNRIISVDQSARTNVYAYDPLNRLTNTGFADLTTNVTVYDDLGRVKFSVDARGITNAFGYNAAGERTAVTNAWGTPVAQTNLFAFDANGNQTFFTNSAWIVTSYAYDPLNRQTNIIFQDGTTQGSTYDAAGRRISVTDQAGIKTAFGYDGLGRLTAVTNGYGAAQSTWAQYQYDEAGNQTAQIDALNRTTTFAYDSMGRRIKRTLPGLQSESFGYDLAGNVLFYTNFNGAIITNQYDQLNRLTSRSSVSGYKVSFAYGPTGQRTNMTDITGVTGYTYDNRDRLLAKNVAWSNGPAVWLNYRYDSAGNLTNLYSTNLYSGAVTGVTNVYQIDSLNRVTNVLASGSQAAGYAFDTVGNVQSLNYGNGITNQYSFDSLNRLTGLTNTKASYFYQLGVAGNRTNLIENLNGTSRTYAWGYDSLYRLTNETFTGGTTGTVGYNFDLVSNRTNRTSSVSGVTNQSFAFNPNDWLTNTDSYDSNGSTTASGTNSYSHDPLCHLINANGVIFAYDGDGNRVRKTVNGTNIFYLPDDRNPTGYAQTLEEWTVASGATNLARVYNFGLALISQKQGSTVYYFEQDGHGSTRILFDSSGVVVNAFVFDAYGILISSTTTPQTAYLYCGEYLDADTGEYFELARWLIQGTGRFETMDTFEGSQTDPLSLHKYLYCSANPVNRFDPTGHDGDFGSLLTSVGIQTSLQGLRLTGISIAKRVAINSLYGAIIGGAAGEWDSILGGGDPWQGFVNGAQGGALFGAAGSFRAIQPLLQVIGIGLGTTATIQAASDRHYAQAGLRGIMTALGAFTTKYWPTVEGTLEQPGSLTSAQARAWYKAQLARIPSAVDQGADWQTKGMQAYVARLMALLRARALMSNQKAAASLPPPKTLSQLIDENSAAGQSGDGLWQSIYYSSMRSNAGVDARLEYGDAAVPFYLWGQDDN